MSAVASGGASFYRSGGGVGQYYGNGYAGNNYNTMGGGRAAARLTNSHSFSSNTSPRPEMPLSSTNLYIRGLSPNCTDDELRGMCEEYGKINSTKAIMDKMTNQCKGYGFVDFDTTEAATQAVEGLLQRGVQAQMAKARTSNIPQQEQDPTNLYIANLPASYGETQLETTLQEYGMVISTRILRNANGESRGVGFARMDNKEKCEDIIRALNGQLLPGTPEGSAPLLVKLADSGHRKKRQMGMGMIGGPMMDYGAHAFPGNDLYTRGMQNMVNPYMLNPMIVQQGGGYHPYSFDNLSSQMSALSMGGGGGGASGGSVAGVNGSGGADGANAGVSAHQMYQMQAAAAAGYGYPPNQYYSNMNDTNSYAAAAAVSNHYGSANGAAGYAGGQHNGNADHEPMGTFVAPSSNGAAGANPRGKYGKQ